LLIEDYFQQIQLLVESSEIVKLFHVETEKRGIYEGFLRVKLEFKDNSLLHLRKFVYKETPITSKILLATSREIDFDQDIFTPRNPRVQLNN